jgi:mannose-6-phosphate isomerase-like protein (cupin superfamily)
MIGSIEFNTAPMKTIVSVLLVFGFWLGWIAPGAIAATQLKPNTTVEVLHPGEGQTAMLGDTPVLFKTIAAKGKSGQISITESTSQPQEGAPLHKHAAETFYVVKGEFEFYAGQPDGTIKTLKAKTGDLINVPAGVPHAPKNVGKKPGTLLTITGADWFQNFLADVTEKTAGEVSELGVPPVEKMAPIAKKYGIEFVQQ